MKQFFWLGVIVMVISIVVSPGFTAYLVEVETFETPVQIPDDGWVYDEETRRWCIEFPAEPLKESFVKKYGILNRRAEVGVIFSHEYLFPQVDDGEYVFESKGYVETSYDRGKTWWVLDEYDDTALDGVRDVYITLTSNSVWVRFTVEGSGDHVSAVRGYWRVWDIEIIGDTRGNPPTSILTLSGYVGWDNPWNHWIPSITIESNDINGIREIHYILDRQETIVPSKTVAFQITTSGIHRLAWWAVDNEGSEETPHKLKPWPMDLDPPSVDIIKPEPGLYLFGKKMPLPMNKTIIIGGFTIEAVASDNLSGVYRVSFYLDEVCVAETMEEPYTSYCVIRHYGGATLKVYVKDFAGLTSEDTLDILYYNYRLHK